MPGQFINNSNSGGVTFTNNSNSGQAIFSLGTPTPPPAVALYASAFGPNACAGIGGVSLPTYLYSGGTTLCDCTSLNAANATSLSAGTYWVSDGTNNRYMRSIGGGSTLLTAEPGSCVAC